MRKSIMKKHVRIKKFISLGLAFILSLSVTPKTIVYAETPSELKGIQIIPNGTLQNDVLEDEKEKDVDVQFGDVSSKTSVYSSEKKYENGIYLGNATISSNLGVLEVNRDSPNLEIFVQYQKDVDEWTEIYDEKAIVDTEEVVEEETQSTSSYKNMLKYPAIGNYIPRDKVIYGVRFTTSEESYYNSFHSFVRFEFEYYDNPSTNVEVTFGTDVSGHEQFGTMKVPTGFGINPKTIPCPTIDEYHFVKWNDEDQLKQINEDKTFIAMYSMQDYNVRLHYNGETIVDQVLSNGSEIKVLKKDGSIDKVYKISSDNIEDELIVPIEEGYEFVNWTYQDDSQIITPNYKAKEYNVTFIDLDQNVLSTQKVQYNEAAIAPEPPVVEGYTFGGWSHKFDHIIEDTVIKPVYSINQVNVTFFYQDKEVSECSGPVDYGTQVHIYNRDGSVSDTFIVKEDVKKNLEANAEEGYTFSHWEVKKDERNMDIIPKYDAKQCKVTFLDYEHHILDVQSVPYGSAVVAPDAPVVHGLTFDGWDIPLTNITKDVVVHALYSNDAGIPKYNVTFTIPEDDRLYGALVENDKEVFSVNVNQVLKDTKLSSVLPTVAAKDHSKFIGWFINNQQIDPEQTIVQDIMNIEARFIPDMNENNVDDRNEPVTVSFDSMGGENVDNQKLYIGARVSFPSIPKKDGYSFSSWYMDSNYEVPWDFSDTVVNDMTLYAKWDKSWDRNTDSTSVPSNTHPAVTPYTTYSNTTNQNDGEVITADDSTNESEEPVKINRTLFIKPIMSFVQTDGKVIATVRMNYGTNVYVKDREGNVLKEYAARQDCQIELPEPAKEEEFQFDSWRVYWEKGALTLKEIYKVKPIQNTPAPSEEKEESQSTGLNSYIFIILGVVGAAVLASVFLIFRKKHHDKGNGGNKSMSKKKYFSNEPEVEEETGKMLSSVEGNSDLEENEENLRELQDITENDIEDDVDQEEYQEIDDHPSIHK